MMNYTTIMKFLKFQTLSFIFKWCETLKMFHYTCNFHGPAIKLNFGFEKEPDLDSFPLEGNFMFQFHKLTNVWTFPISWSQTISKTPHCHTTISKPVFFSTSGTLLPDFFEKQRILLLVTCLRQILVSVFDVRPTRNLLISHVFPKESETLAFQ